MDLRRRICQEVAQHEMITDFELLGAKDEAMGGLRHRVHSVQQAFSIVEHMGQAMDRDRARDRESNEEEESVEDTQAALREYFEVKVLWSRRI